MFAHELSSGKSISNGSCQQYNTLLLFCTISPTDSKFGMNKPPLTKKCNFQDDFLGRSAVFFTLSSANLIFGVNNQKVISKESCESVIDNTMPFLHIKFYRSEIWHEYSP